MVILLPAFLFCRFWKRAGFVPVYLRQTPVSEAWGRGRVGFVSRVGTECLFLPGCAWVGSVPVLLEGLLCGTSSYPLAEAGCHRMVPPRLLTGLLHPWLCASL